MNMEKPNSRPRWRWPRLQFSLRLLLLAFTAFAIGFPIWYRWPYEETTVQKDPTGAAVATRRSTVQRQWGGGRLPHGPNRLILSPGDVEVTEHYVHGNKHGPFTIRDAKGRQSASG